jgi:predicted chitinase
MRIAMLLLLLATPATAGDLTARQLQAVMPNLPDDRAATFLKPLNEAMKEFDVNTPKRQAAFLAQIAHESGELKYMEEIASGAAYEGRKSLGNTEPGDGKRYKGRGPIQLTGRNNYRRAGMALKLDLEGTPKLAAQPDIGCRVAGWFWKAHGLNELADQGDFLQITKRVNGGTKGLERREAYYTRAKEALGVKE